MAHLSLEGTLKKENSGALLRISQALHGLVYCLEEFQEVETMLGLETAAETDHSGSNDRDTNGASPNFLRLAAGTLKEMVGKLVSDIEANPEIQKLLLLIQKSLSGAANDRAFLQDARITKQPPCQGGTVPLVSISGIDSRTLNRAARERTCRHFCEYHPELMDQFLWRTLPPEMVELVFARLPIAKIIDLCAHSTAWSAMSKSSDFRRVWSERQDKAHEKLCNVVYDIKSNEWIYRELDGFPGAVDRADNRHGYSDSMYACDGGLVCFVPQGNWLSYPILVGNPLTNEWKALPHIPYEDMRTIMVQLVMEEDIKCYRVILVYAVLQHGFLWANYAYCYDSKTGVWSHMESGLVHGECKLLSPTGAYYSSSIFDCRTKVMYALGNCSSLEGVIVQGSLAIVKDLVFVLHKWNSGSSFLDFGFNVSEYAWQSSASNLSKLSIIDGSLPRDLQRYPRHLFACSGFVLLFVDNYTKGEDDQLIRLYDSSTNHWHSLSMGDDLRFTNHELPSVFMCELRWDAIP